MKKRPIVLCILDGYGLSDRIDGNAVKLANTPNIDDLMMIYPTTRIKASGMPVGLPDGQMGNSEVGHLNIGAGRTVYQSLTFPEFFDDRFCLFFRCHIQTPSLTALPKQ